MVVYNLFSYLQSKRLYFRYWFVFERKINALYFMHSYIRYNDIYYVFTNFTIPSGKHKIRDGFFFCYLYKSIV